MTEATKRPWTYYGGSRSIYGGPSGTISVAILTGHRGNYEKQNANAELILRAVRVLDGLEKFPDLPDEIRALMEKPDV